MYNFSSITLGVVSTRRDRFPSVENALKNNEKLMVRIHEILDRLPGVKVVYAEKVLPGGLICEPEETNTALTYFREQKIDALLMLHANFGQEEAVGAVSRAIRRARALGMSDSDIPVELMCPTPGLELESGAEARTRFVAREFLMQLDSLGGPAAGEDPADSNESAE